MKKGDTRRPKPYNEWTKKAYDNFREYQVKYYKENYRTFTLKFNMEKDADVISYLESQESLINWVRKKAKGDIARKKKKEEK